MGLRSVQPDENVDEYPRISKNSVVKESFDESKLDENGLYELAETYTRATMSFGIINRSTVDDLIFTINDVEIAVMPQTSWNDEFLTFDSVIVIGEGELMFNAYIKG